MARDSKYVNFEQYHEISDWLHRNNYSISTTNINLMKELSPKIKQHFGKKSSEHLTWEELNFFHNKSPSFFANFEKKS